MTIGYADYRPPPPPPQPPVRRRWFWLALGLGLGSFIIMAVGLIALIVVGSTDSTDLIEDADILQVAKSECTNVRSSINHFPIEGSPDEQADAIDVQNQAIEQLVQKVRALDPVMLHADEPALAWTKDWERLIKARSEYAESLRMRSPIAMTQPTDGHGHSIIDRMDYASSPDCRIPKALFEPYPSDPGESI